MSTKKYKIKVMRYNPKDIEKKWQNKWINDKIYKTEEDSKKPKYYILDMFPYPSGEGLHIGHAKVYTATDTFARAKLLQGYNVLHPTGWDAFGLPAENFAIKNKIHPRISTDKNINNFRRQMKLLGLSYDWDREVDTTDPKYYKWTQWIFLKLFEKGLAYESFEPINWCPTCKTGLANEDLEDGKCERCSSEIEKKPMRQWTLRITDYAERLLDDLKELDEWEDPIKEIQKNWIGKSEGTEVSFLLRAQNQEENIKVFTTRVDTLFGCSYIVIAPEHNILNSLKSNIKNQAEVEDYINMTKNKSDLERTDFNKDKDGVLLDGIKAINPINNEEVLVFVADYVLASYGTGMVMAVPSHDERDYEFAYKMNQKYQDIVKFKQVITNKNKDIFEECFTSDGFLIDSGSFTGLHSSEARQKITDYLVSIKKGDKKINYKLKDWVFSRQRYWGEPIPIIRCDSCGNIPVEEKDLPVVLPDVENYEPSGTGQSPLANIAEWVNTTCPKCKKEAKRETNTMPQWAGSSWYYLRFVDNQNEKELVSKEKEEYWSPVDFYIGGIEHAARHLIYARFWHKFLYDIGVVNYKEPFKRLQHVGLVLAEDGRKMSKRWNNVINPDDMIEKYGADATRLFEMFMGPFSQACAWSTGGVAGMRKFLERVWNLKNSFSDTTEDDKETLSILHQTIKKVGENIEEFKFNTAISQIMILVNHINNKQNISKNLYESLLIILSPFAPHITEELWESIGNNYSITKQNWPKYNENLLISSTLKIAIQINGKVRGEIEIEVDLPEKEILEKAKKCESVLKYLENQEIKKEIYIKGKIVSLVI